MCCSLKNVIIFYVKQNLREINHQNTVWKFHDFSIIQILREINFGDSTNAKYAILTHLEVLNFAFNEILHF